MHKIILNSYNFTQEVAGMIFSSKRFTLWLGLAVGLWFALGGTVQAGIVYQPIDFSAFYNSKAGGDLTINGSTYPTGAQTYLGVPFQLDDDREYWASHYATGANPRTLELNVSILYVREVHTLISTYWGEKEPGTFAYLEFFGTGGAYFKKDLDGNDDIRDYNYNPSYTIFINDVTTKEVWDNGMNQHLDKQFVDLPDAFDNATLTKIILADNGDEGLQRTFLFGITAGVSQAPIPGAVVLLGSGLALLLGRRLTGR